jgi:hypothetical protein
MYVASQVAIVVTWIGVILVLAMKDLGWMAFGTFFIPPAVIVTVWWTTVPLLAALIICIAAYFGGMGLTALAERHEQKVTEAHWADRERRAIRTENIRAMERELDMQVPEDRQDL